MVTEIRCPQCHRFITEISEYVGSFRARAYCRDCGLKFERRINQKLDIA